MFYQYIFEGVFSDQLGEYIDKCLEKFFYGFKKAHLTQHVLFCLLQTCQKELENSRMIRTVLMDLSKAYDCILHALNVAKLEAYDLDKAGLISQRSSRLQLHQKKKRLWHRCFPVNFAKFLRIPFSVEYLRWLLLNIRIQ